MLNIEWNTIMELNNVMTYISIKNSTTRHFW